MTELSYRLIEPNSAGKGVPIKAWVNGVPLEATAEQQLRNIAGLPFIYRWVAAMPDVHWGMGATIGSVIPTTKAIIPAAVGVDIGCGMMAVQTSLRAKDLPENLQRVRSAIESAVPHGGPKQRAKWNRDSGCWQGSLPPRVRDEWKDLKPVYDNIKEKHPVVAKGNDVGQLGTLGGGNHFIEICLDETDQVWFLLHSGSRGVGNRLGTYFIELAKKDMRAHHINLPDQNLAYFNEGTVHFDDYVEAVEWAQKYAMANRKLMMEAVIEAVSRTPGIPPFEARMQAINCHHNYVARENHYGRDVLVTRKGAVRAGAGELGIIPGSMGARSFIVRGKGNPESFHSCSHGAGRLMSRTEAKKRFTLAQHCQATAGVECRKDQEVIDETPGAYKDIDAVMKAQADLVEVVHSLKQVVCVKG